MSDLFIIESPNKIKKIKPHIGGADVIATLGHFKDLPEGDMGVDATTFEPKFHYVTGKKKVADRMKDECKGKTVYIATDPDREGYAIGTFAYQEVKKGAKDVYRVEIREITAKGIKDALAKKVPFSKTNAQLFDAYLGRRVGDRIVGYTLSPAACKELKGRYSVGRVQSPAVRLVAEREKEIREFKPEPYWLVHVLLEKDKTRFKAWSVRDRFKSKADADGVLSKVTPEKFAVVDSVDEKQVRQAPKAPFTTVDLQAAASAKLRFAPDRTMRLAQDLFEAGKISYHRTDSVRIAPEFIEELRRQIERDFGAPYLPAAPRVWKSKASQAEAHEAIRPTETHPIADCGKVVAAEGLSADHEKLYELIYKRTIASQMNDAVYDAVTAIFDVAKEKFKATGRTLNFDGFLKVYTEEKEEKEAEKEAGTGTGKAGAAEEESEDQALPKLSPGEKVPKVGQDLEEKTTKPPKRYTEASLVKKLEKLGIGRPSTYASIVKTIKDRDYVTSSRGTLSATWKGERLAEYLEARFPWVVDFAMTRQMEERLDEVEEKKADWKVFVSEIKTKSGTPEGESWEHSKPGEEGVSQKQKEYAESLAAKTGIALPKETLEDRAALSKWIDGAKEAANAVTPLSEKQMAVIRNNADPDTVAKVEKGDVKLGRAFLDKFFGKSGGKRGGGAGKSAGPRAGGGSRPFSGGRKASGGKSGGSGGGFSGGDGTWRNREPSEKALKFLRHLMTEAHVPDGEIDMTLRKKLTGGEVSDLIEKYKRGAGAA